MSWLDDRKDSTPAALTEEADRLLGEAEEAQLDKPARADRLAMRANRLRTMAAKAMIGGPEKLALLVEVAFLAATLEDQRRARWAVREAVGLGPDEDQMEDLREYWECSSWTAKGDGAFPEPPGEGEKPWRPDPNQMSFLEDA